MNWGNDEVEVSVAVAVAVEYVEMTASGCLPGPLISVRRHST